MKHSHKLTAFLLTLLLILTSLMVFVSCDNSFYPISTDDTLINQEAPVDDQGKPQFNTPFSHGFAPPFGFSSRFRNIHVVHAKAVESGYKVTLDEFLKLIDKIEPSGNGAFTVYLKDGTTFSVEDYNLHFDMDFSFNVNSDDPFGLKCLMLADSTFAVVGDRGQNLNRITVPGKYLKINITQILERGFESFKTLEILEIPNSIKVIGDCALQNCSALTTINFSGTLDEWLAIKKGVDWDKGTGSYVVNCADGKLSKKEPEITPTLNISDVLGGKTLSILSDSLSTYEGWSNDGQANSTIENNLVYYTGENILTSVEDTWWKQTSNETCMEVLVNNSISGSTTSTFFEIYTDLESACGTRATNLHDDVGINSGTNPDVIAVYMGSNDMDFSIYTTVDTVGAFEEISDIYDDASGEYVGDTNKFATAYATMIHRIITAYPEADVFCFTLVPNYIMNEYEDLEKYNGIIRYVADYFDVGLVDLYANSGITSENHLNYTDEGLHFNAQGMDLISDCFIKALEEYYL